MSGPALPERVQGALQLLDDDQDLELLIAELKRRKTMKAPPEETDAPAALPPHTAEREDEAPTAPTAIPGVCILYFSLMAVRYVQNF